MQSHQTGFHNLRDLAITATFTAEPLERPLAFWMTELNLPLSITFSPYGQVFQQLLDPASQLSRNQDGINVVLVRLDEWIACRSEREGIDDLKASLEANAAELIGALKEAAARSNAPLIVGVCPDSPEVRSNPNLRRITDPIERSIAAELGAVAGLYLIGSDDFDMYPVSDYHDVERCDLAHIPYTPLFFAALGTIVARKIHALIAPPRKVVVLDCDNTLWRGVVVEDGIDGITIPSSQRILQQFMKDQVSKGFLLCLCSKNDESDVLAVFDRRPDMILKRHDLVSWRVNWQPKSDNIRSLAAELKLGVDSFIFIDDNPVECAEVRAGCPEVLTLQLPTGGDVNEFCRHIWAFDRLRTTIEDRHRAMAYRQEANRARCLNEAPTIGEFLAGLDLRIAISKPGPEKFERVAQLTQRTNQFNFTTVRRNDSDIQRLPESDRECRVVEVKDRFGDYGLVGVMITSVRGEAIEIDTFLLSCRVLGRGVEHGMLNELGEIARRRQLSLVAATLIPSPKNLPARDFLDNVAAAYRHEVAGGWRYEIPADVAAAIVYIPGTGDAAAGYPAAASEPVGSPGVTMGIVNESRQLERIVTELFRPNQVLECIRRRPSRRRVHRATGRPVAPRTEVEAELAEILADVLQLESVGIEDNYFDLGGTSLQAVDVLARIEQRFGKKLPLSALIQAPTIKQLATLIEGATAPESLVVIRTEGGQPPLFLVHDGDGETMLYRSLAMRLDRAVYGLQPHSGPDVPMVHTRIPEMAAFYIDRMRSVQPDGPYLIGGMCAGGVIAFEMALQLQRGGEKVGMVALIDAADVDARQQHWHAMSQRLRSFSTGLSEVKSGRIDRRVVSIMTRVMRKARSYSRYLLGMQIGMLRDEVRTRLFREYVDRGRPLPRLLKRIPVRAVYLLAEKTYQPMGTFNGELELFRATSGVGHDEPYVDRYEDPALGWRSRATRGVVVHDVPGGHSSMLHEPHVRILAEQLTSSIARALGDGLPIQQEFGASHRDFDEDVKGAADHNRVSRHEKIDNQAIGRREAHLVRRPAQA